MYICIVSLANSLYIYKISWMSPKTETWGGGIKILFYLMAQRWLNVSNAAIPYSKPASLQPKANSAKPQVGCHHVWKRGAAEVQKNK